MGKRGRDPVPKRLSGLCFQDKWTEQAAAKIDVSFLAIAAAAAVFGGIFRSGIRSEAIFAAAAILALDGGAKAVSPSKVAKPEWFDVKSGRERTLFGPYAGAKDAPPTVPFRRRA